MAFESEHYDEIAHYLGRCGMTVWARNGRVHPAQHSNNTESDVDTVLDQLAAFASGRD